MTALQTIILVYLLTMNGAGFAVMGIDKLKAKKDRWRVPEKVLFFISALGGSIGTLLGMYVFRHKTKHWYFVIGMPLILILHLALAAYLIFFR